MLHWLEQIFVVIGALNWGLVGFFQFDLVAGLFGGQGAVLSRIIYGLVGLASLTFLAMNLAFHPTFRIESIPRSLHVVPSQPTA